MHDPTDAELTERAKGGDEAAYGELIRRHQAVAFRVAYLVTRSAADAEEATQDGFVKAWRALGRFRDDSPFRPWVLHIVRNEARNAVRSRGRRQAMQERLSLQPTFDEPGADAEALAASERSRLLAAVDRLPTRLRDVVSYLYLLDMSETEAATVLGVPRGTVKSRAARARALLAEELDR